MNGDNFRYVSVEVSNDILSQFYAMERTHPRCARPFDTPTKPKRTSLARAWPPEARAKVRNTMLERQAKRIGLDVSELPQYRYYRYAQHLTAEEAIHAVISSRKPTK